MAPDPEIDLSPVDVASCVAAFAPALDKVGAWGSGLLRSTRGQCRRAPPPVAAGVDASVDGRDRAAEVGGDLAQAVAVLDVRGHGQVERRRPDCSHHGAGIASYRESTSLHSIRLPTVAARRSTVESLTSAPPDSSRAT